MTGSVPKEIQGIPTGENTKIVHLPTQETRWREGVVGHVQRAGTGIPFTTKEATPDAVQPIPNSADLKQVQAERTGAIEFPWSMEDVGHNITTAGTIFGGEDDQTHVRTAKGGKLTSMIEERLLKKAA